MIRKGILPRMPFQVGDEVRHRDGDRGRVLELVLSSAKDHWRVLTEPTDGRTGRDWWIHGFLEYHLTKVSPRLTDQQLAAWLEDPDLDLAPVEEVVLLAQEVRDSRKLVAALRALPSSRLLNPWNRGYDEAIANLRDILRESGL